MLNHSKTIISSAVLTTNSVNINSQACPACWHRSHSPADPAPSGILPYPPSLNPKPWGDRIPKQSGNAEECNRIDPDTLPLCLVAPHGTLSVLSVAKGSSQWWWWWWWHNCDLSTVAHFKVKKREPGTGLSAYLCVCVCVCPPSVCECRRVTCAAVSKNRLTVTGMCRREQARVRVSHSKYTQYKQKQRLESPFASYLWGTAF